MLFYEKSEKSELKETVTRQKRFDGCHDIIREIWDIHISLNVRYAIYVWSSNFSSKILLQVLRPQIAEKYKCNYTFLLPFTQKKNEIM